MEALLKKLNFKHADHAVLINAPDDLAPLVEAFRAQTEVQTTITKKKKIVFALCFVTTQKEINALAKKMEGNLADDAMVWFAYPKGTSKRYTCDFNRDTGWEPLGGLGLEAVRQIAIDDDWTALRFRDTSFVKTMTRNEKLAISPKGKQRTMK